MSRSARPAASLAAVAAVTVITGAFLTACGAAGSPDPAQPAATVTVTAAPTGVASQPASSAPATPPVTPTSPTSPASPVSTVSPGSPASAKPPASPGKPGSVGPAGCLTSGLRASLGAAQGAAGSAYQVVLLANTSGKTCALYGYPGVSFVSAVGGAQIGAAATRDRSIAAKVVTLAPGQRGSFTLRVVNTGTLPADSCRPVAASWLKIFPPENTAALYVGYAARACSSATATILSTRAVTEGTGGA
jgi:hypothetical protein